MAVSDSAGEMFLVVLLFVAGLACYGGYKAYEEWVAPRAVILRKQVAAEMEAQRLRAHISDLGSQLNRAKAEIEQTEYELDATHYLTGREITTAIFRGTDALDRCERRAITMNYSDVYYYYCRTARR